MYIGFWSKWGNYLAKIADLQAHSLALCPPAQHVALMTRARGSLSFSGWLHTREAWAVSGRIVYICQV